MCANHNSRSYNFCCVLDFSKKRKERFLKLLRKRLTSKNVFSLTFGDNFLDKL